MTILIEIFKYLTSDIRITVITLLIGVIIYKLLEFYQLVFTLPPGPIPWPLLGNISLFITKNHCADEIRRVSKKYGPVFTIWMGNIPYVFITDIDIARYTFSKTEFCGRPESWIGKQLSNAKITSISLADADERWEALRRVTHFAVQKYSTNEKLVSLSIDCVDRTIKLIIDREGVDQPFDPRKYIYYIFLDIIVTSLFGISYNIDDQELNTCKEYMIAVRKALLYWGSSPVLRLIEFKRVKKFRQLCDNTIEMLRTKFISHYNDYDESVERSLCDALISAKNAALKEGKDWAQYLTDDNLSLCIADLLNGGTDTLQQTFQWIILLIANYPNLQKNLRQEIESEIGVRMPSNEDKSRCHYVMAFISETLRLKNVIPSGFFHKAMVRGKIDKYTIPESISIFVYQGGILNDDKYWSNPDQFIPERFLANGKYMTSRPKAYIPFGLGRRVCLGEKLGINELFIVLVRFLQLTTDIVLHSESGLDADPSVMDSYVPKKYKICLKRINKFNLESSIL